jgi:tRNA G10  N-methylase Trm11
MTKGDMASVLERLIEDLRLVREAGQNEYAHNETNAFANFERVAERMGSDRKAVLMVYLEKHLDGIHSHIQGNTSQREDVRGRIKDAIMYLALLYGMVEEDMANDVRPARRPPIGTITHINADL